MGGDRILLDMYTATNLSVALGKNKKIRKEIDKLYLSEELEECPANVFNHIALTEGSLKTEIYGRKVLTLLLNTKIDKVLLSKAFPAVLKFIDENTENKVDLKKLIQVIIKKSGGIDRISDEALHDQLFFTYVLCNSLGIEMENNDYIKESMDGLMFRAQKIAKDGASLVLKDLPKDMRAWVKKLIKAVELDKIDMFDKIPYDNMVYNIFDTEPVLASAIYEELRFSQKDVNDVALAVVSRLGDEFPTFLESTDRVMLQNYMFAMLHIKWMLRAFIQVKKDFFLLDPSNFERKAHRLENENLLLTTENERLKKENEVNLKELEDAQRQLRRLQAKLEEEKSNKKELAGLREMFFNLDQNADPDDNEKPKDLEPLKNQKSIFVGGHQNLQRKLKELFPDWVFISSEGFDPALFENVEMVYFYSAYCSHALYYKVLSVAERSKIKYLSNTNVDRLIKEML